MNFFAVGDSITTTSIDELDAEGWLGHLADSITNGLESPTRIARGGADIFEIQDYIDADLSSRPTQPHKICILIGANDVEDSHGWPQDETTWKADYQYVIDALHTKYSSAPIYLGKSYRNDAIKLTRLTTLNGWIDDLVSTNSVFCYAGVNSYDVFYGHSEYMADEVHPNHNGCVALASAWKTLLDY